MFIIVEMVNSDWRERVTRCAGLESEGWDGTVERQDFMIATLTESLVLVSGH